MLGKTGSGPHGPSAVTRKLAQGVPGSSESETQIHSHILRQIEQGGDGVSKGMGGGQ